MDGYVAVTDFGWYEHLSRDPELKEANFWRPSTRQVRLEFGTPFFFKLKAPHNAIAGYGYFAGFTILPDWLAWDTFGTANGVDDLTTLRGRLAAIQDGASIQADPLGKIGCCLIAETHFFPRHDWVTPPSDWGRTTQVGATYSLDLGEGLRILTECEERSLNSRPAIPTESRMVVREPSPRYGTPLLHTPRLGQGIFRIAVLDAYGRACAVTEEHSLPVLEAAHIRPYAEGGEHAIKNGLLFRSDIHRLFDRGYVTVDDNAHFFIGHRLKDDFENGRSYYGLQGHALVLPADPSLRPSAAALDWHRQHVFLG